MKAKMENRFSPKLKDKSSEELRLYINNKSDYQEEAIQAAIWELEKRQGITKDTEDAKSHIKKQEENRKNRYIHHLNIAVPTITGTARLFHFLLDFAFILLFSATIRYLFISNQNIPVELLTFPFYYIITEYKFQTTLGKYPTGFIIVDADGNRPTMNQILIRTLCRYIPFEAFSCIGSLSYGWHDKFSHTFVISETDLQKLKKHKTNTVQQAV